MRKDFVGWKVAGIFAQRNDVNVSVEREALGI